MGVAGLFMSAELAEQAHELYCFEHLWFTPTHSIHALTVRLAGKDSRVVRVCSSGCNNNNQTNPWACFCVACEWPAWSVLYNTCTWDWIVTN